MSRMRADHGVWFGLGEGRDMFAFPGMISKQAEDAGIKVPADPDDTFSPKEFPHFAVFCSLQLGRKLDMGNVWPEIEHNALVIAKLTEQQVMTFTLGDFVDAGMQLHTG